MRTTRTLCLTSLLLTTIIVSTILVSTSTEASTESESSKISGFVIGSDPWRDPFGVLFVRDPLFTYSVYPSAVDLGTSDKRKLDRVYYPRTRQILIESYDLMVFAGVRMGHFIPRQIHDLDYAFREAGVISILEFHGSFMWDWGWEPTILYDVAPISGHRNAGLDSYWVRFRRERNPVFLPFLEFGIEKIVGNAVAEMDVKQGATIWGEMKALSGGLLRGAVMGYIRENQPWLVSWKPAGGNPGMQWVFTRGGNEAWWSEENNPYALDVATNMILHSLDRPLISDIPARRKARRLFTNLQSQKSLVLSMMEWADTFGANIIPLSERLTDLEQGVEGAIGDYMEQNYAATITFLQSLSPTVSEIAKDAVRLKDEALFWIYIVEWLTVTSAGIISGVIVWNLMIRRRMYRTIETTKLRQA
jgi:hypothetical protein